MHLQETKTTPSTQLQKLIESFYSDVKKLTPTLESINSDLSSTIKSYLALGALSYSVLVEAEPIDEIERTSSMICGPSFVSEMYPRPSDSDGNLMFPILQFNLSWINIVCEKTYIPGLLQLWWSPATTQHELRLIPEVAVTKSLIQSIDITPEMIKSVKEWGIPDDWMDDQTSHAFVIKQCVPIGITHPEFEDQCYELIEDNELDEDTKELLYNLSSGSRYSTSVRNALFNLFGDFSSPNGVLFSDESFLCTPQWCGGMMTANIFFQENKTTAEQSFTFEWGR